MSLCYKVPYESRADALADARYIRMNTRHRSDGQTKSKKRMKPYSCLYCNKWHLTAMKQQKKPTRPQPT